VSARKRRELLTTAFGLTALVVLIVAPGAGAKAKGFSHGVTATEVSSSSAILWAHADKPGTTYLQIVHKFKFGPCDKENSYGKVKAKKSNDNTVQEKVTGFDPDTDYEFRYCTPNGGKSDTGKFTTAPKSKANETIRFALTGDQDARPDPGGTTPHFGNFEVWNAIRKQKNDFNVLMGDTIYSDTSVPGYTLSDIAITVAQKWANYQMNLAMKPWAKARGSAAYYAHWDDHEFINDFAPGADSFPYGDQGSTNIDGEKLYADGVRAFIDYNPVTYSKQNGIYRTFRWGKNLEVFFLDQRSFRSTASDYQGVCDNPPGSGNPDLAPTAPESTRQAFAPLVPQFNNPPPPGCVESINDPNRTMLGANQLTKFQNAIKKSNATFKVIFNEVPIQQFYANPYDRWEGYEAERQELLRYLRDNVKNVVFLTTDDHGNLVNDARFNTLGDAGVQNSGILDITTGPIATETFSDEVSIAVNNPNGGPLVHDAFFKPQPPNGLGMPCAAMDQYSYAEVEVSKSQMTIDLLDVDDQPVIDTGDASTATASTPRCPQIVIPKQ
jgi:alkaline phosphatase D